MSRIVRDITQGFFAPMRALRFLGSRPRLWPLALMPALITFILLGGYGWWAWDHSAAAYDTFVDLLGLRKNAGETDALTQLGIDVLRIISLTVLRVMMLVTAVIFAILLGKILAAPFNDALSEKVELAYLDRQKTGGFSLMSVLRGGLWAVTWEAKKVGIYLLVLIPLLLLNGLPLVGTFLYTVVVFLFNVMFLAFDYLDFPLERRPGPTGPLGFKARGSLVMRHKAAMLGFGTAATILLFVPLLNFLFLPLAVSGATLLYLELEAADYDAAAPERA